MVRRPVAGSAGPRRRTDRLQARICFVGRHRFVGKTPQEGVRSRILRALAPASAASTLQRGGAPASSPSPAAWAGRRWWRPGGAP